MHSNTPIRTSLALLALSALCLAQAPVWAQNQTLKVGGIRYDAHSKSNGVTGIGIPPGADATVGDATTLVFTYEIEVKPNVGIELVIGVPPRIKAQATGSVAFLGEVLTARNVAPTLLVNYHFGQKGDALRPYIGLGINYTKFTGASSPFGWDVKLRDSVGLAGHVGLDYALSKDWGLFASFGMANVKSKLVATGATVLQSTIDFRPRTYAAGAYFKF